MEEIISSLTLLPYLVFTVRFKSGFSPDEDLILKPIYQCLDRYNDLFFVKGDQKKCLVYKDHNEHTNSAFEYHFPYLPVKEGPIKIMMTETEYDKDYHLEFKIVQNGQIKKGEREQYSLVKKFPETWEIKSFTED